MKISLSFCFSTSTSYQCPAILSPPPSPLTCTLKFGFPVTESQRLSSAHLLWLKPLMKNNWCNRCVPYQPVPMLDSRVTIPDPVLVGHIWAVQVGSTFHALPSPPVKWRQTQSDPSAMQCQVFRKCGFPQRWSVYVSKESRTSLRTMEPGIRKWKHWVSEWYRDAGCIQWAK